VVGVIGDPVEHSLSPVVHNAALAALGFDWAYVAFPVPAGRGGAAVSAMADLGVRGLSVTMPHKAAAAGACHRLSAVAERLGVVNTVTNAGGELAGDSTDGQGFLDALADQCWVPEGRHCVVLGAGGAARAVVLALAQAGARRVEVVARREDQARAAAALAGRAGAVGPVESVVDADLVVNATPVGMVGAGMVGAGMVRAHDVGQDRLPFDLDRERLGPGQLVADLIYAPAATALVDAARARGAGTCNGLGMLVHQAALQFRAWTRQDAPVEVMRTAAAMELQARLNASTGHRGGAGTGAVGGLSRLGEVVVHA
jgi:shikimate dehydrogenase